MTAADVYEISEGLRLKSISRWGCLELERGDDGTVWITQYRDRGRIRTIELPTDAQAWLADQLGEPTTPPEEAVG